ncbi:membrane protein insertion efficiency factor YidD [Candidatus Daviesbacteria bacterium]|nr:membrane protein insertion efficiency factor YidD [Candidatus Daviesbacteria bacterium]
MNLKNIIISIINFYQKYLSFDRGLLAFFAPGGACRFEISCSEYTKQKIGEFGILRGVYLGMQRVWRCR